jgi:hypothetical protein
MSPLEQACLEVCANCREAKRWEDSGRKGHTLRFRDDTQEWVHDFISDRGNGQTFDHRFCYATDLRKKNG